jgi:membrane dipeptidase
VPYFVSRDCMTWAEECKSEVERSGGDPGDYHAFTAMARSYAATHPRPVATVADVADHVEHARDVAGIDHIGIGGDYDGCDALPEGLRDVTGYPALFAELLDRGWSDAELTKLAGANVLRTLADAEDVAAKLAEQRGPSLARIAILDAEGPSAPT